MLPSSAARKPAATNGGQRLKPVRKPNTAAPGTAAFFRHANGHQFWSRARLGANAPHRVRVPEQHTSKQQVDHASHGQAQRWRKRYQGAKSPGHGGKQQVSHKPRSEKAGEIAGIQPHARLLCQQRRNHYGPTGSHAGRAGSQPQGQRLAEYGIPSHRRKPSIFQFAVSVMRGRRR